MIIYSVVIPAHNEAENLPCLIQSIASVMGVEKLNWELIVVDDCSEDSTWDVLTELCGEFSQLKIFRLHTRSGQTAAFAAAFSEALGEIIITLDGDGQNNPADIPKLLALMDEVDCVCGYRDIRNDPWQKRVGSKIANGVRRLLLRDGIRDSGCSLKVFRADPLLRLPLFRGMHRFFPSLLLLDGANVRQVAVSHRPRTYGKTHYSLFSRGIIAGIDLLVVWWMKHKRISVEIEKRFP